MTTDDDTYVRIEQLEALLAPFNPEQPAVFGHILPNSMPERKGSQHPQWQISESEWPSARGAYPPYASGAGYAVSQGLARWIRMHREQLEMMKFEDVSAGIWYDSARKHGVNVSFTDTQWWTNGCCFKHSLIVHKVSFECMYQFYNRNQQNVCERSRVLLGERDCTTCQTHFK